MPVGLHQIMAATRRKVAEKRRTADFRTLEKRAEGHVPRGFRAALESKGHEPAIIAELKKASPSRGLIRANFEVEQLAMELESAGAAALSVLTDMEFFQGSLPNLEAVSHATSLPCLRKDFVLDEFQLLEARAHCADAVLLIVAALSPPKLTGLVARAAEYKLDVLCEVHNAEELQRALDAGCNLIGVNNRDLRTFKVDLQTAFRLAELMPKSTLGVAESGIQGVDDVERLRLAGYRAFLIGESLMRAASPGEALRALIAQASARQHSVPTALTTGH
jgi:indole-3-glycerol phosphate synthase